MRGRRTNNRRSGRLTEPPSIRPWQAAVLAIDTAARSGWSLRVNDDQREFGECDSTDHEAVLEVIRWGIRVAGKSQPAFPLALVLEDHPWAGTLTAHGGLRAARERWLIAWHMAGQPTKHVVKVTPAEWRARVLGPMWARAKREAVRLEEKRVAEAVVAQPVGADEAAAILIGRWAARAGKVGTALGLVEKPKTTTEGGDAA